MSAWIIPLMILCVFLYANYKKVDCYDSFVNGASKAFTLCKTIFPFIVAILIAVSLMRASGLMGIMIDWLAPMFTFLGIPPEVSELVLLRPFTGSGSLAILENILKQYGPDSYISRCASSIMGSSETVFYVATIYFSKTKVKKLLYAIPVALICSIVAAILACLFCKWF